jgi:hypothetical protein
MTARNLVLLTLAAIAVLAASSRPIEAQLVEIGLIADDVNSDLGLLNPNASLVSNTLTDTFTYDPNNPTSSSPTQAFAVGNNYHASGAPSGNLANMFYELDTPPNFIADSFALDLWGRADCCQARDDNFDVLLRSGGFDGLIVAAQTGFMIPNNPMAYLRVEFDSPPKAFDTVEVIGHDVFFTIMEVRAAALNPCEPGVNCPTAPVAGDLDGDGDVDVDDGEIIAASFYQNVTPGESGDIDFDGFVGFRDFRSWKRAFAGGAASGSAVPEPTALVLALLAAITCGCRGFARR